MMREKLKKYYWRLSLQHYVLLVNLVLAYLHQMKNITMTLQQSVILIYQRIQTILTNIGNLQVLICVWEVMDHLHFHIKGRCNQIILSLRVHLLRCMQQHQVQLQIKRTILLCTRKMRQETIHRLRT